MDDADFLSNSTDRAAITKTCNYLERAVHELQLMNVRKNMTITQMQAQINVIKKWMNDLDGFVAGKKLEAATSE